LTLSGPALDSVKQGSDGWVSSRWPSRGT